MENITVESWEEFDEKLKSLLQTRETWKNEGPLYVSEFMYRGQPNSDWHLKTTLERIIHKEISMLDYYRIVHFSKHRVETFTEKSWDIPSIEEYKELLEENKDELFWDTFPAYDYIAYLRHLGFPSPLLDWTSSPYVAAFFAFDKVSDKVSHVSLYVLLE